MIALMRVRSEAAPSCRPSARPVAQADASPASAASVAAGGGSTTAVSAASPAAARMASRMMISLQGRPAPVDGPCEGLEGLQRAAGRVGNPEPDGIVPAIVLGLGRERGLGSKPGAAVATNALGKGLARRLEVR